MADVILPDLQDEANEAIVVYWHFEEGDKVEEGEDLVELATDKTTFNLPVMCSGILTEIFFEEGELVKVGEVLAVIKENQNAE